MKIFRAASAMLLLGFLAVGHADAQELESFGVVGGISRATMGGGFIDLINDVGGSVDARFGFALGGFAAFGLAPNTSLRGELMFTQKGFRVPPENGLNRRELDVTYFDLSALVRRSFPLDTATPWVGAGPVLSFRGGATGVVGDSEGDFSDEIKGVDFGLGIEAGAGRNNVDVGLRYLLGLSNITESSDPDESSKNRTMFLTVSYSFPR
jgi:hypothetical protein